MMNYKTFQVGDTFLIGASLPSGKVAILDGEGRDLIASIRLPADCRRGFDVSADGRFLTVGYMYLRPSHIEVWDIALRRVLTSVPKRYASEVGLPANDRYIAYWSSSVRSGTWVHDLVTGETTRVRRSSSLNPGAWMHGKKQLLLPTWRATKGGKHVMRVRFDPLEVTSVPYQAKEIWVLDAHPSADVFVTLESDGTLTCVHENDGRIIWRTVVPRAGWVRYTGDGRFLGLEQEELPSREVVRLIVIDSATGTMVGAIEQGEMGRYPLSGPRLLSMSGHILNLESGSVEPGLSDSEQLARLFVD